MLESVEGKIDLRRYIGKWHEIAAFPAWFEINSTEMAAKYTREQRHVIVENSCKVRAGTKKISNGKHVRTKKANVLRVQFFPLIKPDYIIEFVDASYHHAIIGSITKKYLWIISRKRKIDKTTHDGLVLIAKNKGYDVSKLK